MEMRMLLRNCMFAAAMAAVVLASTAAAAADGVVQKIDADQQKLTLKHGPIANLGMPAMTMVFKAADPGMLKLVKVGDKVKFDADRVNGQMTITRIEKMK
jgi:Cu/Ag efflux protein CusF